MEKQGKKEKTHLITVDITKIIYIQIFYIKLYYI
jgi:hypothetical protein